MSVYKEVTLQVQTLEFMLTYVTGYQERNDLFNLKLQIQEIYKDLMEMYRILIEQRNTSLSR